eukprot:s1214_g14.t1
MRMVHRLSGQVVLFSTVPSPSCQVVHNRHIVTVVTVICKQCQVQTSKHRQGAMQQRDERDEFEQTFEI